MKNIKLSGIEERCWVNWKYEERDGKTTKVPYTPTGTRASSKERATWSTYAEVIAAADRFDGIGIVFTGSLLGIDIDHCISEDGSVPPEVAAFVEKAQTYTEVSPSKTGLHILLRLTEPMELVANRSPFKEGPPNYEAYSSGRYFTVTGNAWNVSHPLRTVTPAEACELLRLLGYPWNKQEATEPIKAPQGVSLEDSEVLSRMFASKNGPKIKTLFEGGTSEYGDDDSAAEAALCAHLAFWTGGNPSQMESIWLASPLGAREKTQNRVDYRKRTIKNALALSKEVYTPPNNAYKGQKIASEAILVSFADITSKPIEWLWPGRIALGKVTLFSGDPGLGKSLVTTTLAAIVSRGLPWPVDGCNAPIGDSVIVSAEDAADDTIRPRLDAAGADVNRISILKAVRHRKWDGSPGEHTFSLRDDLDALGRALATLSNPRLVIIDPISAYLGGTDSHNNSDVRGLLAPLAELAERHKVAVVVVSHLNKNSGDKNALYRTMGSLAFTAASRACFAVIRDPNNDARRLVVPVKNNLASDTSGVAYSIRDSGNGVPVIEWDQEPVIVPRDQILSGSDSSEERSQTEWAMEIVSEALADGPVLYQAALAEAAKYKVSPKVFRIAGERLGVIHKKKKSKNGPWLIALPKHDGHLKNMAEGKEVPRSAEESSAVDPDEEGSSVADPGVEDDMEADHEEDEDMFGAF